MNSQASQAGIESPIEAIPSLFRICAAMGTTLDLGELLDLILRLTMEQLDAQQGSILLFHEESEQLKMLASRGLPDDIARQGYVPRKGSIAEWVINNDKPLILNDVSNDARFTSVATERSIRSAMCVPLRARGKVTGTINISRQADQEFTANNLHNLVILASQAAVSIENARLYERNLQARRLAMIGEVAAGISHCTKNMLTGLKGGADVIRMGVERQDWKLVEQGMGIVQRNSSHVSNLVMDMLECAKTRRPVVRPFQTETMLEDVFDSVGAEIRKFSIRLTRRIAADCREMQGDSEQIYRAVLNLVTNACDAVRTSSGRGEVEVIVERLAARSPRIPKSLSTARGGFYAIEVRDTGPGIPREYAAMIFEPFFSSKGSKGTGLGLPVSRKIAREHGGDLVFDSPPDEGTRFSLILPVAETAT